MAWRRYYWKAVLICVLGTLSTVLMDYYYNREKFRLEFQSGRLTFLGHILFLLLFIFVIGPVVFGFTVNKLSQLRARRRLKTSDR
jgi:hypothetical protein